MRSWRRRLFDLGRLVLPVALVLGLTTPHLQAQQPKEVKVGLIVPLSGLYARPGAVMRMGAEMAIERINSEGGIKALGGAKLKLVVLDCGDTTEKAKNAAQRMVAEETDLVAASGSYLSSFTLAVTEVTERANLPMLTLSYSDLITQRGFKYIFQTSATSGSQAEQSLPVIFWKRRKALAPVRKPSPSSQTTRRPRFLRLSQCVSGFSRSWGFSWW